MSKTIKIIDLLNKIANREIKRGTRIILNNTVFLYDFPNTCRIFKEGFETKRENDFYYFINTLNLNKTVEIIEDEQEIVMTKKYDRPFYEIVCGLNNYALGTIIESESGQRYKLTKTDNDYRKFSRIDRGLRFMTYENSKKKFRIVEEQEEIDIQGIEELPKILFLGKSAEDVKVVLNTIIDKQNEILDAVKQLDNKLKEK